jgi:hypothetical protein
MRDFHLVNDIDRQLEDAALAKQQLEAERWREQLRPRAMRLFAARTAKLTCSRALLKLLVEELHPDDLFTDLWAISIACPAALAARGRDRRRASSQLATRRSRPHRQALARVAGHAHAQRTTHATEHLAITTPILRLASTLSRLSASLRPHCGAHGLDRLSVEPRRALT